MPADESPSQNQQNNTPTLAEIIKIDLHIHSKASEYKDNNLVSNSTIENLDTLIQKLEENEISLCAITDHNRFDYELYKALKEKIAASKGIIKKNLPGVEFDVQLECNKPQCHIIAIFDDSDDDKLETLQQSIASVKFLTEPSEAYDIETFESILRKIGLKVLLIVHQRQATNNVNGHTNSLSNATSNPAYFIKVGYIDCLEYSYPRTEGIVKNSLRELNVSFPLITGSDCHEWSAYPYHDSSQNQKSKDFTFLKCLPSFKGLLLSLTSFETRANRNKNQNLSFIKELKIGSASIPLSNGINVIIGDNGSGKTLIAQLLNNNPNNYYKNLINTNRIECTFNNPELPNRIKMIEQGEITNQVRNGSLFNNPNYFQEISTKNHFERAINEYFDKINVFIRHNIESETIRRQLQTNSLQIKPAKDGFYHPVINSAIDLCDLTEDSKRLESLESIIDELSSELTNHSSYYRTIKNYKKMRRSLKLLSFVKNRIYKKYHDANMLNSVKSIIKDELTSLQSTLRNKKTSEEQRKTEIINEQNQFINSIVNAVQHNAKNNLFPQFPEPFSGKSTNNYRGYLFVKTAEYDNANLKERFYKTCFNKSYQTEDAIRKISSDEDYSDALSNYKSTEVDDFKNTKVRNFIKDCEKETTTISEVTTGEIIGNTPGENALVYYKFTLKELEEQYDILIADQPEDNINPNRIAKTLNSYIGNLRDRKQIFLITHSPLIAVNLDADNIIYLRKIGNQINAKYGALEYEDSDYSILDLIKNNLDGGYDAVERRLKIYEQSDND